MPTKPSEFMTQARMLLMMPKEVNYRSAISRAYYCLFHEVRENIDKTTKYKQILIDTLKEDYKDRGKLTDEINQKIENYDIAHISPRPRFHWIYKKALLKIDIDLGNAFGDFEDKRNEADYDLNKTIKQDETKGLIEIMRVETQKIKYRLEHPK
jgi:hypothetical protein